MRRLARMPDPDSDALPVDSLTAEVAVIGGSGLLRVPLRPARGRRSRRRTASRPRRSRSATLSGRPVAFLPRHGRDHEFPAAPDQLPGEPLGAALPRGTPDAGAVRGREPADRARSGRAWSCPTSSSTGPRAGSRPTTTTAPARGVRRPVLPEPARPRCCAADDDDRRRGSDGRDRGSALLDPRRVPVVRRPGLVRWST